MVKVIFGAILVMSNASVSTPDDHPLVQYVVVGTCREFSSPGENSKCGDNASVILYLSGAYEFRFDQSGKNSVSFLCKSPIVSPERGSLPRYPVSGLRTTNVDMAAVGQCTIAFDPEGVYRMYCQVHALGHDYDLSFVTDGTPVRVLKF